VKYTFILRVILRSAYCFSVPLSAAPSVKDSKATAEIVPPKDANPIVKTAATEFQDISAKMSGAQLDSVNEPAGKAYNKNLEMRANSTANKR
jgi:hypothetical protein